MKCTRAVQLFHDSSRQEPFQEDMPIPLNYESEEEKENSLPVTIGNFALKTKRGGQPDLREGEIKVFIQYPSGPKDRIVNKESAEAVKYLALDLPRSACRVLWNSRKTKPEMKKIVAQAMDDELRSLCSTNNGSLLRQGEELIQFSLEKFETELRTRAPITSDVLELLCTSERQKKEKRASGASQLEEKISKVRLRVASMILNCRCPELCALASRIGLIVRYSGAGRIGLETLHQHGVCPHPVTIVRKAEQLGENHDQEAVKWKEAIEEAEDKLHGLRSLQSTLKEAMYVEQTPLSAFQSLLAESDTGLHDAVRKDHDFETLDLSGLQLACLASPMEMANTVFRTHTEHHSKESAVQCCKVMVATAEKEGISQPVEACDVAIRTATENMPHCYQIIGDNLDLHINVKHMTNDKKNKSLHVFNMIAIANEVSGNHLPDIHQTTLDDVSVAEFLPSSEDVARLKKDLIPLWSRVVVIQLEKFKMFKDSVVWHIPHEYSEVMQKPSHEVPLGVLPKNENLNDDMIDIMETIQERYVPKGQCGLATVFFGGDQLTEERARNVQIARSDGHTKKERLEGIWPKNEDWHAIRIAYDAVLKILNKPNSVMEWGTYASNAVVSGNSNGLLKVMDNYDKVKEFFAINLDAFITAASLKHFCMDSVCDAPTLNVIPPTIRRGSTTERRQWLHKEVSKMLDMYVMDGVLELEDIHNELAAPQPPMPEYPCRYPSCSRKFKYVKCLLRHELKEHGLDLASPVRQEDKKSHKESEKSKQDGIYNYGCQTISLGLLLRDADDAVKEGDGERLCRIWKFLTFLYRVGGNNKYALAGLRLTSSQLGLLTPRQAHQLQWNRFAATKYGPGKRISRDLRLENINLVAKGQIKALGFPNINNDSIVKATKSTGNMEKLLKKSREDLGLMKRETHNSNKSRQVTFNRVLRQVHGQADIFSYTPGRQFASFPDVSPVFKRIKRKQLHNWIKRHKRKWHPQNRNFYSYN